MVNKYMELYRSELKDAIYVWNDTERGSYDADVWYNKNRNEICLEMLGDLCKGKQVLSVGAALWAEGELLSALGAKEVLRTDILVSEGIELLADACSLPFRDESFDVVICRDLIEHVLKPNSLMYEAHRVLGQNGFYFITTPNVFNSLPDGKIHVRGFTPNDLLKILERYGFKIIAKRGNIPNILHVLLPLTECGATGILPEFIEIAERFRHYEDSYYVGQQLFVLAQKVANEG